MKMTWQSGKRVRFVLLASSFCCITLLVAAIFIAAATSKAALAAVPSGGYEMFMPLVSDQPGPDLLCRFGVNVVSNLVNNDTAALRMGWYVNYQAAANPARPSGAEYMPIITLGQVGANGYTYAPSGATLQAAIAGNPGTAWFIGNEPDRRDVQNDLEPHVYANAYHELYYLIKGADPTARIFAGTIVQPTPIRLQYLDMVLASYQNTHGQPMPVDGWSIHNFILNEVSCDHDPSNCWGAEIPPGIDAPHGEILTVDDNDNMTLFIERIENFRQWMADNGYGGLPVYLSEYGILMPADFGFDAARVNAFMNNTFDYMRTATDPVLGDPNDGFRLIQRWSWYSTTDQSFNGWLFDPVSHQLSSMGANYAAYTAQVPLEVDVYPRQIYADTSGGTVALKVVVANSGNLTRPINHVPVQFYDGDPAAGGNQIGAQQMVSVRGCGDTQVAEVLWPGATPGSHQIYVVVDPGNYLIETNEQNNVANSTIVVSP